MTIRRLLRRRCLISLVLNNFSIILVFFILLYFTLLSELYIDYLQTLTMGLILSIISSIYIFIKIKKWALVRVILIFVLITVPSVFFIIKIIYSEPQWILRNLFIWIVFSTVTIIITFIFYLIYQVVKTKKYQIAFNVVMIILVAIMGLLLYYQIDISDKRFAYIEEKRLKLIENKFGGEKNLKCSESETIKKIRTSIVRVIAGEAEGSGFVINDRGYILTNFHVIEFQPRPKIIFSDKNFETVDILYADKNADLAILKTNQKLPAIDWGNSDYLNPAEEILVFGYPFGGSMSGEATVKKGYLSAKRRIKDKNLEFLQTDSTLNPGMSGGPMVTVCGEFVGVNTLGTEGMGMAISSNSFKQKYLEMITAKEPLKDIKQITFEPNKSPLDAVSAFYNYIKIRKMDKAYALLSDNFLKGGSFEQWKKGYEQNLDTSLIKIENDQKRKNVVNVKLLTKDFVNEEIVYKYFEGWWEVKEIDGNLKLWQPKIKEIKEPSWLWFYE